LGCLLGVMLETEEVVAESGACMRWIRADDVSGARCRG
jgi:hypothetical protein